MTDLKRSHNFGEVVSQEEVTILFAPPQFIGRNIELLDQHFVYTPPEPGTRHMTYFHDDGTVTEEIL